MKKLTLFAMVILVVSFLGASANAYTTPFITPLKGDVNIYSRLEAGVDDIKLQTGDYDIKGGGLITITNMIGDNDGYGYGHEIVPDGADLPYVNDYGWQFDNRSPEELAATNGAQATDVENNFDATFMHKFDMSQFDYLTEAYFTIDISGLQQNVFGGVSRLFIDGIEVMEFLAIDQGVWGSGLFTYAVDLALLRDGALDVYYDNWSNDFGTDHTAIDFTMLTVKGYSGEPIPEPATALLVGLGLVGFGLKRRFRK